HRHHRPAVTRDVGSSGLGMIPLWHDGLGETRHAHGRALLTTPRRPWWDHRVQRSAVLVTRGHVDFALVSSAICTAR
ncbi:hypothetical protein, partial [Frankia sp. AvcI1]